MRAVAVIPARYGSTRFPGKPVAPLLGRPLVAWVVEAAAKAREIDEVWVATDDDGVAEAARAAGGRVAMTSPSCSSGSDRVAEAAHVVDADVYVNLQGDEPLVDPSDTDALVRVFRSEPGTRMATLARPLEAPEEFRDPDVVKVVCDARGNALYFSRASIPHYRDAPAAGKLPREPVEPLVHLGVYAYSKEALFAFARLPRGCLEQVEGLEQLRALEAGWTIRVLLTQTRCMGVDRPEDVAKVEEELRKRLSSSSSS